MSRYPTGDHHPPKMILHDDTHGITDDITTPIVTIPSQLMAGVSLDDQKSAIQMEDKLQESLMCSLHTTNSVTWEQVQIATSSDDTMTLLLSAIENGFPELKHLSPPHLREFHQFRRNLYSSDGVVIYKNRIVIPPALRQQCLSALHAAHQGTSAMTARAETSIFWPGITNDIHATRANCSQCNRMASVFHTWDVGHPETISQSLLLEVA